MDPPLDSYNSKQSWQSDWQDNQWQNQNSGYNVAPGPSAHHQAPMQSGMYPNLDGHSAQMGAMGQQGAPYNQHNTNFGNAPGYSQGGYNVMPPPTDPYNYGGSMQFSSGQFLADPMVGAAAAYGQQMAQQHKEKISRWLSLDQLKYYFDVDNAYVAKKLGLLFFPYAHQDWSMRYQSAGGDPLPPRWELNAPDLYVPLMAVLTYVMVAGLTLGFGESFSPEQLGLLASNALAWLICENLVILGTKFLMNISHSLGVWHALAYSSYKFVGMTLCLLVYLAGGKAAYYGCLAYCAASIAFFLIRSVKSYVLSDSTQSYTADGKKRKLYLIVYIALTQPLVMWWLTSGVISVISANHTVNRKFLPIDLADIPEDMIRNDEKLMAQVKGPA